MLILCACSSTAGVRPATGPGTDSPAAAQPIDSTLAVLTFDSAWSIIARAHYDTAYNGVDWDGVAAELRPAAAAARTTPALRSVITAMLERLGESHYAILPQQAAGAIESGGGSVVTGEAGLEVRLVEGDLVVWRVDPAGAAAGAGVRTGWRVVAIDGRPVRPRLDALAALPADERRVARTRLLFQANAELTGVAGEAKVVDLMTGEDETRQFVLPLRQREGQVIAFANLPPTVARLQLERIDQGGGCAAVIRFTMWLVPLVQAFDDAVDEVRDCTGIVVDLRGNPGGVAGMVMGTAGHFLNDTLPLGFMKTRTAELRFKANPRRVRSDGTLTEPFGGRLAILTDEMTASTSEFFAEGLQAVGRARVFGTRSAGQALPALMSPLPNGDVLMHVVADFTGPDGTRIEGRGVVPDVVIETTRRDLLYQRDAPLMAALDWISGGAAGVPEGGPTQ